MKKFLLSIAMGLSFMGSCHAADSGSAFMKYAAQKLGYTSQCSIITDENGNSFMMVEHCYKNGKVEREFYAETSMRFQIFSRSLQLLSAKNAKASDRASNSNV